MWHIIYLGLLNVLVGVSSSVAVRHRAKWVQRQLENGYDFERTFPPKFSDRLPLIGAKKVDMKELCQAIDPGFSYQPADILLEVPTEIKHQSAGWIGQDSKDEGKGVREDSVVFKKTSDLPALEQVAKQTEAPHAVVTESESVVQDSHKTMEVIDLQSSEVSALEELSSESEQEQADEFATEQAGSHDLMTQSVETETPETVVEQVGATKASEQEELHEDLLRRLSKIESALQLLMDDSTDSNSSLIDSSAKMLDAAKYWKSFRDSANQVLHSPQRTSKNGLADSIDSIVEQVNREVASCCEIAGTAVQGNTGLDPKNTAEQLRTHVLHAASGSHQLRDQMAISVPATGLPFENCTPIGLPDYFEGLAGLNQVLQSWMGQCGSEVAAGIALIDIDNFNQINNDYGLVLGDQVLSHCCEQICKSIRHNRGFDRVIRVGGQQFLLFFGFTSGRDCCYALERIRQSFAQTDFEIQDELTHIDIRASVIPFDRKQNPLDHLQRLREGLAAAKDAGGNRVVYGEFGLDFEMVEGLPEYDLPIKSIEVKSQCVSVD